MLLINPKIYVTAVLAMASLLVAGQTTAGDRRGRPILTPASSLAPASNAKSAAVEYLFPEQVTVLADKPSTITLHFRVAQGLHINSHTPRHEYLIPTTFSIPEDSGVRLEKANYPPGTEFTLPLEPTTRLNVYTGEFTVQARIVAAAGNHLVEAKLRYQACNSNSCMPPKTITAAINIVGK
jgi:hypothetical protein